MLSAWRVRSGLVGCLTCLGSLVLLAACSGGSDGGPSAAADAGTRDAGDATIYEGPCDALECQPGTVCDADSGSCVPSCATLSCSEGQRCEVVGSRAECRPDCDAISCGSSERCDDSQAAARCVSRCGDRCGQGQHCVGTDDNDASCQDLSCSELACELPMVCAAASDAKGGHVCKDESCSSDLQCEDGQYCSSDSSAGGYCKGAECTAGEQRCGSDAATIEECLANGSGWFSRETCLTASCTQQAGEAFCPCSDDWSCPAFTTCEVARCEGTGVAPTCFVSVVPMENALPSQEFQWGTNAGAPADLSLDGTSDKLGETHPFPQSIQVVNVPIVANLTDDNGDGEVNELDYPEIVFLSYCGSNYQTNGMLRAIHGGGSDADHNPLAGKDFFAATGADCNPASGCDPYDAASWLVWNEGEDGAPDSLNQAYSGGATSCQGANDVFDSSSSLAVGNLDGDPAGYPEIVVLGEQDSGHEYVYIFDATGHFVARSVENVSDDESGAPAIANLDGQGLPEIVVGRYAWTLKLDGGKLRFDKLFLASRSESSKNGKVAIGPVGCLADLNEDGRQDIIAGSSVYDFPDADSCTTSPCPMSPRWTAAVPGSDGYCAVADVWGADTAARPHPVSNPLDGKPELILVRSGKVYVIDGGSGAIIDSFPIAGTGGGPPNIDDFDGDGMPEVGTAGSSGYTVVDFQAADPLDAETGCPAWPAIVDVDNPLTGVFASDRGPYPAADPASAGNPARVVPAQQDGSPIHCTTHADCNPGIDPYVFACNQSTGDCVCLHNGWTRKTQDGSSEATGSSVFDFNGDGAAEVIYNDECFFRIFDGINGRLYSRIPSESRTRSEYPVVADLDNDGNAEIVFGVSNESGFCDGQWDTTRSAFGDEYFDDASGTAWQDNPYVGKYNAGIEVWGEPRDLWVSARRIWNQHAYHVTNVTEGGAIPALETPSWSPTLRTARGFNSYRSNPPSRAGVAPDLQVVEVDIAASGGGCEALGSAIAISARIRNAGDLRVGADIKVAFYGNWGSTVSALTDHKGRPLVTTLGSPLRAGGELLVRATYDSTDKTPSGLPQSVTVIVDPDDVERECDGAGDTDNQATQQVVTPDPAPDLRLTLDEVTGDCPNKTVAFTVHNDGGQSAANIQVRLYAGNPAAGGNVLATTTLAGPLEPGQSISDSITIDVQRDVSLFGEVDPEDKIAECSDGNNDATYDDPIICGIVLL